MTSTKAKDRHRPRILVALDWYLPAYRAGGPIRSISNLIATLGDEFDFRVICGNQDLGQKEPLPVETSIWHTVGKAQVMYWPQSHWTATHWQTLLLDLQPDMLYINSLYSGPFGRLPLKVAKTLAIPTTLAPRGMLGAGALSIKPLRKKAWLWLQRATGHLEHITWHASTQQEAQEIQRWFPRANIHIALNLPVPFSPLQPSKTGGGIHLLSVGRVHPIKNYRFGLELAQKLSDQGHDVTYRIVGPIEDEAEALHLNAHSQGVKLEWMGATPPQEIQPHFGWSDLVLVPSFNENFGHAVAEGVAHGKPVLVSDQTAWSDMNPGATVQCLPLDIHTWLYAAATLLAMSPEECIQSSKATYENCLLDARHLAAQRALFNQR